MKTEKCSRKVSVDPADAPRELTFYEMIAHEGVYRHKSFAVNELRMLVLRNNGHDTVATLLVENRGGITYVSPIGSRANWSGAADRYIRLDNARVCFEIIE